MSDTGVVRLRLKKKTWYSKGYRISTRSNGEGYVIKDVVTKQFHILNIKEKDIIELYPEN